MVTAPLPFSHARFLNTNRALGVGVSPVVERAKASSGVLGPNVGQEILCRGNARRGGACGGATVGRGLLRNKGTEGTGQRLG